MPATTLQVPSTQREQLVDCTRAVQQQIRASGVEDGICHLFCQHTTAGLTLNENTDPDVQRDLLLALRELLPVEGWPAAGKAFRHFEHNADAHIKASLLGFALSLPILGGQAALGQWQAIYLAEFDGPRTRQITIQIIAA